MRPLVLLAGMTPTVTTLYYDLISAHIRTRLGGRHSPKLYIYSTDLEEQLTRVAAGNWYGFADEYITALRPLLGSVQGVALGAILAHKVSSQIEGVLPVHVEFLDVARFVASELKGRGVTTVGVVGPKVTMCDRSPGFFVGKLEAMGVRVLVPEGEDVELVQRGMMDEVAKGPGMVRPETREMFLRVARGLVQKGATALVLGSTDLGFVIGQKDFGEGVLVLDAAKVHAVGLAEWMLGNE